MRGLDDPSTGGFDNAHLSVKLDRVIQGVGPCPWIGTLLLSEIDHSVRSTSLVKLVAHEDGLRASVSQSSERRIPREIVAMQAFPSPFGGKLTVPFRTDSIVRFAYAVLGLHTGLKKRRFLQNVSFAAWFIIHVSGISILLKWWHGMMLGAETRSFSIYTLFLGDCVTIGCTVSFYISLIRHHEELKNFIRRNGRRPGELLRQLAYATPVTILSFWGAFLSKTAEDALKEVYYISIRFSHIAFFLVSSDIVRNLMEGHDDLMALTAKTELNHERIRFSKWELRDRIERLNQLFSWLWGMHHAEIFNMSVFSVYEVIDGHSGIFDKAILLLAHLFLMHRLFDLARGSSSLKERCLDIEARILSVDLRNEIGGNTLLRVMAFREECDILRSGPFPLEKRKFINFLATSVTCIAVILQFDIRVLEDLNRASGSHQSR